jgi:hypothetical protein
MRFWWTEFSKLFSLESEAAAHPAMIAGFIFLDRASSSLGEFEQISDWGRGFVDIKLTPAGMRFVFHACPRCGVRSWTGPDCRFRQDLPHHIAHDISDHIFVQA